MKKTMITLLASGLLAVSGLKAQTIQEGMNHLYADRFKSAIGVFEKLLAANPNNIEATYWLGQVYFDMDDNVKARSIYEKALQANGSAPLILVGLGHADLHDNKPNDARQRFEAAITASTNGKKGADPLVLSAIGRANVDAKAGDAGYAVQKLEEATAKDPKNTEILLQLGNAYRKANPGQGGGQAFETYNKALTINPSFAVADLRLAKLFESQKNSELILKYLNDAVKADSKFAPAYYELFYYYFFRAKFPEAEAQLTTYMANADPDIQHEYLYAQLCWAKKDFNCAVTKAESVAAANGDRTKPKVYKLLADAYYNLGNYASAKANMSKYFAKEKPEDQVANDYRLWINIITKAGSASTDEVYNAFVKGSTVDTVLTSRIDILKQGALYFKDTLKLRSKEADLRDMILTIKPNPTINDYFDVTIARYFAEEYAKASATAETMVTKFPDQVYGYEWAFNAANAVDTVRQDSVALPTALALNAFAEKDTAKYKKQYLTTVKWLGSYYINKAKDRDKALEYFRKWLTLDPANATAIEGYIKQIEKMPARPASTSTSSNVPPRGNAVPVKTPAKPPAVKTTTKTTVAKTTVKKK